MTLTDRINNDIKAAMLAKDKEKLESLRAVKAALLIASTSGDKVDADTDIKILQRLIKQRKEAADIYTKNGRQELADNELKQVSFIEPYLPQQMDPAEIKSHIVSIIGQLGATSIKDMGKVMGAASKLLAGKAENKVISDIVKELLS